MSARLPVRLPVRATSHIITYIITYARFWPDRGVKSDFFYRFGEILFFCRQSVANENRNFLHLLILTTTSSPYRARLFIFKKSDGELKTPITPQKITPMYFFPCFTEL